MGWLFLIEYDQTPGKNFYLCRLCHTHVALARDFLCQTMLTTFGVFEKAINLLIADPVHYQSDGNTTVADVFCTKCNKLLGQKYVQVEVPTLVIREGRIDIDLNKLQFWNGHQLVDAIMVEPPYNI